MNKTFKILTTRLFVALIVLSEVGWIILFGKNLPSSITPVVYVIIGITIVASIYIFWKKSQLLQNKKVVIGLVIFVIIGAIGWITSISEITDCRPYKCGEDFKCAKPSHMPPGYSDKELNMESFFDGVEYPIMNPLGACKEGTHIYNVQFAIASDDDSYKTFSDVYHNIRICVWPKDDTNPEGRSDLKICKTKRLLLC